MDGLVVTVDGEPLDDATTIHEYTDYGFEWSYEGASPQQLALAILVDFLGDGGRAIQLSDAFMKEVIANLDNDWTLTGADIEPVLAGLESGVTSA